MVVDVYNAGSTAARRVFARMNPDDILRVQIQCTAVINVDDDTDKGWAYFTEDYNSSSQLHRPYMVVQGTVSELVIEDDDPRVFPCGAKRLRIMDMTRPGEEKFDPIDVRVNWLLSANELSYLYSIGLGNSDFEPPQLLKGNTLEIPVVITYEACYESPVCAVKINDPFKLDTSTKYNMYDTIFMNCTPSKELGDIDIDFNYEDDIPVLSDEMAEDVADTISIPEDDGRLVIESDTVDPVLDEEAEEDASIAADIRRKMEEASDRYANERERRANVDEVLATVRQQSAEDPEDDLSGLFGAPVQPAKQGSVLLSDKIEALKENIRAINNSDDDSESEQGKDNDETVITDMTDYRRDTDDESSAEARHEEAEEQNAENIDKQRRLDVALDNKALNAGITDISGFGASQLNDSDEGLTDEQKRKKDAQKALERQRSIDRAQDNIAFNEGRDDVAGFGSGNNLAQQLLSGVLNETPPDDGQRYL